MIAKSKLAALAALCASTGVFADHHGTEETRNHQAHVHGEVRFDIAQEGKDLILAISAPGADIVGFEHAAETAQEKEILKQALARLETPEHLFSFEQVAQCKLSDSFIEQSLSAHDEDEHHGEDKHH
ncbi:ZrgA family zinc uptake protein, partial [Moritella viscosa]